MQTQRVFKALSDPNRRQILKLLQGGALSAGELAEHFDIGKASLSHHFAVLRAAELVRTERRGQRIVYSLNTTVMQDVAALLLDVFRAPASKFERRARKLV
jgi:ArsR family transcriptional regulator, arsenate/arsenite/antimonite-responsive transcriptional repressor